MRHKNSGRKFNRTPSHRKALLKNLAIALIKYGRITTTVAKAKTLRGVVEPLVTLAFRNDVHARRQAFTVLGDRSLVSKLFDEIAPLFTNTGGYTRVVKLAQPRKGDAAPMAIIEFVKRVEAEEAAANFGDAEKASKKAAPKKAAAPKAEKPEGEAAKKPRKTKKSEGEQEE